MTRTTEFTWNLRLECLSLQTALYLDDRLNTWRRLVGFSLLSTRCQTSCISPTTEYVTIPPTIASGNGTAVQVPVHQKMRDPTPLRKKK